MASIGLLRKIINPGENETSVNSIPIYSYDNLNTTKTNEIKKSETNEENDSTCNEEIFILKNEVNILKSELNSLKYELYETKSNYKEFYTALIAIQDKQNQDIKNMRKKIIFLMKKSMDLTNGYEVTSDEEGEVEKTIHF